VNDWKSADKAHFNTHFPQAGKKLRILANLKALVKPNILELEYGGVAD
jgi:hypothetical protein